LLRWSRIAPPPVEPKLELATEAIAVSIRWFGLAIGVLIANFGPTPSSASALNIILILGLGFTALDTFFYSRSRVFLRNDPLFISGLEAIFIGLLCYYDAGLDSPFRFYYLLSLICCAIRYSPRITFITCGFDCLSYGILFLISSSTRQDVSVFLLTVVILIWITWAASAMARLLKRAGEELRKLNTELTESSSLLEMRITERTRQLEESQGQVLHQEKMAAFGLLAAGIAHEVGNPLTSISSIVQMLEHRDPDAYMREKLTLVNTQLARIQVILRELITFSRPANDRRGKVSIHNVVMEAMNIAKYYKGGQSREITVAVPTSLPTIEGVHDQLVQVIFNLILNAIDATSKGGRIEIIAVQQNDHIVCTVADNGHGIDPSVTHRLFRPYFTTKKHGTGLGLFVIRRIIEAHRGTVSVSSELQQGTTFTAKLPTVAGVQELNPARDS